MIERGFKKGKNSIIFQKLTQEITDHSILAEAMGSIMEYMTPGRRRAVYNRSTRNQGLFKAYGGLFYEWKEAPWIVKDFIINDLISNYQS